MVACGQSELRMAQSILELQKNAVLRMLNLGDGDLSTASTWKVLVYDKFCQEVVSLLLKVGGLRNHGASHPWVALGTSF